MLTLFFLFSTQNLGWQSALGYLWDRDPKYKKTYKTLTKARQAVGGNFALKKQVADDYTRFHTSHKTPQKLQSDVLSPPGIQKLTKKQRQLASLDQKIAQARTHIQDVEKSTKRDVPGNDPMRKKLMQLQRERRLLQERT